MKYTRYDFNKGKNNSNKFGIIVILMIVIALIIGTVIAKFIFLGKDGQDNVKIEKPKTVQSDDSKEKNKNGSELYTIVQCGYYSKKENAEDLKNSLKGKYEIFILPDGDKYRAIAFVGKSEEGTKLADKLTTENITVAKVNCKIDKGDVCNSEIAGMISGYIDIVNKLKDKDVKAVKTEEFKKWTNTLKEETSAENYKVYKQLQECVNKLPAEITKADTEKAYSDIFKALSVFKAK